MTIKIPVQADTGSSTQELSELERSFSAIAKAVESIEASARRTASALDTVTDQADRAGDATKKLHDESRRGTRDPASQRGLTEIDRRVQSITRHSERLARVQGILGKTFGREFGADESEKFVRGFETNRRMSPKLREFKDVIDFYENADRGFDDSREGRRRAARYRREVMNRSMVAGDVDFPEGGRRGGGGGGGAGADIFGAARRKGMARARMFAGGMLAIAGITSVLGMAAQGVNLATEEGVGADTLMRSLGDLGVDFQSLREKIRGAGDDLGVASIEALKLAQHFTRVSNADRRDDVAAETRNAIGFARAYGLDPNASATFFGQMRHYGVTSDDDKNSRRMAALIADAVQRGRTTAKTEELLSAVTNFTAQATRLTLTRPNVEGYLGMLAGMTRTGLPGMGPTEAANIIGMADTAMRRGGGVGEASMNFAFNALARRDPSLGPVQAQMLMGTGLFGTAKEAFGEGSTMQWVAGRMRGRGEDTSFLPADTTSDMTNLVKIREHLRRQGFSAPMRWDALKNFFSLQSHQQAAFLDEIDPETLTGTQNMLKRVGMDINKVSPDAMMSLSRIADASDTELRNEILPSMLRRDDLGEDAKQFLGGIARTGDDDRLREEMAKMVAARGQEKTEGTEIRDAITDLKETLTRMGDALLPIFIGIRSGVSALVGAVAPGSEAATRFKRDQEILEARQRLPEARAALAEVEAEMEGFDPAGKSWLEYSEHHKKLIKAGDLRRQIERDMARLREGEAAAEQQRQRDKDYMRYLTDPSGTPMSSVDPQASRRETGSTEQRHTIHGEFYLRDPNNGQPLTDPLIIRKRLTGPRAAGMPDPGM